MKKEFLSYLGFTLKDNSVGVYFKKYHDNSIIEVDFEKEKINYGDKIKAGRETTQNFKDEENWVVLECVNRLLEKGYKAEDIILEKDFPAGRGVTKYLDILVLKDGHTFLMIECKTLGKEFDKELKNMQTTEKNQLVTYFQQDRKAEFLVLYASSFNGKKIEYQNEIIKIEESYKETSNAKDFFDRWNKFTKQNGIFDNWVNAYDFESKALTLNDLKDIQETDASFIFNRFLEILRHNTVSDKGNAFNKIFTLFLCKIHDEGTKMQDEELEFQWKEGIDNNITFQTRLTDLYKKGMMEFLSKEITDFNNEEFNQEFGYLEETVRTKILEKLTKLRLQKNNEFAIKEVFDDETFEENAVVLKEVVELLQNYRVRYTKKQPFLGDFFELLLTTGLKQEAGQFFTPVPIARFICKSIPIKEVIENKILKGDSSDLLPATIDYAAGSGHFLTESMEEIQNIINNIDTSKVKPNVKKELDKWKATAFDWAFDYMYGIEKDYRLVKTAKVGCYLHGDGIATVIHGDGLDSFENSKTYKNKLKRFNPEDKQENAQFDFVLSNPPYSVSAFKGNIQNVTLKDEKLQDDFGLFESLTDNSSEIEALFIERTKQLLKEGGIAAIILPSSILSNTGIYTKAREVILKNFEIISIVSLGSNTFMATGTNTVVLFMRKRNKFLANNLEKQIEDLYKNLVDVSLNNIENVFSKYVNYVWEGLTFEDYKALVLKNPNEKVLNHEIYKEYSKKLKLDKKQDLFDEIIKIEKEKMLYFVLSYSQNVVLVKSGEKQAEKEFLGYEFSFRKGSEGIHPIQGGKLIDECTKLFDPENLDNPEKVSTYIYDGFNGDFKREISDNLQEHIFRTRLVDLLPFDRVDFEKTISTNIKKKISIESKWELVKIENAINPISEEIIKIPKKEVKEIGKYPVISQEKDKSIGFIDLENPIKNLPLVIFGDHNKVFKYVDYPFFVGADGVKLLSPKKDFIPKFFYSILESIDFEGEQSYQRHYSILKEIKIPLPPRDIQEKIVSEIEILEKEEQEKKKKVEILKSEIEKIVGGIEGEKVILGDICDVRDGTHDSPKFYSEGFPLVTGKNLINGKIDLLDTKLITQEDYDKINQRSLVEKGDVLFGMIGTIGNPVLVDIDVKFAIKNVALFKFKNNKSLDGKFFRHLLDTKGILDQLSDGEKGKTQRFVGLNILRNLKIPLPTLETQKQIVSQIEKIESEIEILEKSLKTIPEKKKEVLKKYL